MSSGPGLIAAWPRDAVILDVGCGYGRALRHLRDAGFRRLIGLDIAADFLARARQDLGDAGTGAIEFFCASCLDMPLADGSADIVLLLAVVSNCIGRADAARLVAEVGRVLRPGGIVLLQEFLPRPGVLGFRPGGRLVRAAGGLVLKHRGVRALRRMLRGWDPENVEFMPFETWTGRQHPGVRMILRKRR